MIIACGYFPSPSCDDAAVTELPEPTTDRDEIQLKIEPLLATGKNLDRIAIGQVDAVEEDAVDFHIQSNQRQHVRRNQLFHYPKELFRRDKL